MKDELKIVTLEKIQLIIQESNIFQPNRIILVIDAFIEHFYYNLSGIHRHILQLFGISTILIFNYILHLTSIEEEYSGYIIASKYLQ